MSFYEKMKQITDNIRYRTGKTGLLGLDAMDEEIKGINWVEDPFFAKAEKVGSKTKMTDKTKLYIFNGTLWRYQSGSSTIETVTEQIVGTADNPWSAGRLSSGNPNGTTGYVTTPYIDLTKYSVPFALHLKGIKFVYNTDGNRRWAQYKTDKTHIQTELSQLTSFQTYWKNTVFTDNGDDTCTLSFTPPVTNKSDVTIGFARFSGQGTEANANVYITYEKGTVIESAWIDTGITATSGKIIPTNETLSLPIQSVKNFMNSAEYKSDDYSYTQVTSYASGSSRKDLPNPLAFAWDGIGNAILYAVSVTSSYLTSSSEVMDLRTRERISALSAASVSSLGLSVRASLA